MKKGITPAALNAAANGDLENFIAASTPGGIEAQEAKGQQDFVANETLPKDMMGDKKEDYEKLGFVFGESADDIFVNVKFPDGWKKKATDHSMHSDLLDEKGRKRASIFYKAAFYDRSAHISLNRRFSFNCSPEDRYASDISYEERKAGDWYGCVEDCGEIIHKTDSIKGATYEEQDQLVKEVKEWLSKKYPEWESVLAYWD
jgi:hypothetical protein